ncbi:hypothetical protein DASC09_013820 [Saccharomycopsis crataegensis]|uniref:Uncharacterized protein n=1 Tax=Saccharomycopsis crataegensis TaxID=43959 RepID=A0AAV5QHF1_9ASCO|nr:hypothetical protein DASC09_013820 [Saccharomycopsis crataegensis]
MSMNYEDPLIVNVLPCLVKTNGEESMDLWKQTNTKFNGESTPILTADASEIKGDQFYAIYKEKKLFAEGSDQSKVHKTYFRGRKFFGEHLGLDKSKYQIALFESSNVPDSETKQKQSQLLKKADVEDIMIWEHEKTPGDSLKTGYNFQNQWFDVKEMLDVSEVIHE